MTDFGRTAIDILRSAENVLSGKYNTTTKSLRSRGEIEYNGTVAANYGENEEFRNELVRQLHVAVNEINNLRVELTAEKDSRSQTLLALGKRWKEEVLVDVRSGDHQTRRDFAELESHLGSRLKEELSQMAVLRRQVEDLQRVSKIKDGALFEHKEQTQEEIDALQRRVDAATAQCSSVMVECTQQLERERASLSHRLDSEMLRYADMRQEDQRSLQQTKAYVKEQMQQFGARLQEMVNEAWKSSATALERTLREPIDTLQTEVKQTRTAMRFLEEKMEDTMRTFQSEMRLQNADLKERVSALESKEAVQQSRVDRAEKKADAAYESAARAEGAVQSAKELTDRAWNAGQQSSERCQRVEEILYDRDTRLVHVEMALQSISSAEQLKAELEACKRNVTRVESRMDAVRVMCERDESLAERTARQMETVSDNLTRAEKSVSQMQQSNKAIQELVEVCQRRVTHVEEAKEALTAAEERRELAVSRLEQRSISNENACRVLNEKLTQSTRDVQQSQQAISVRVEAAHELASRCDTVSAGARAEVDRLERRLLKLESTTSDLEVHFSGVQAEVAECTRGMDNVQRRLQQSHGWQQTREERLEGKLDSLEQLENDVRAMESKLEGQINTVQESLTHHLEDAEAKYNDLSQRAPPNMEKRFIHQFNELQRKLKEILSEQASSNRHRSEAIENTLANVRHEQEECQQQLLQTTQSVAAMEQLVHSLEEQIQGPLQALSGKEHGDTSQVSKETLGKIQKCEESVRKLQAELKEHNQRLVGQEEKMNATLHGELDALKQRLESELSVVSQLKLTNQSGGTQEETSSTVMASAGRPSSSSPSAQQPAHPKPAREDGKPPVAPASPSSSASREGSGDTKATEEKRSSLSAVSSVRPSTEQPLQSHNSSNEVSEVPVRELPSADTSQPPLNSTAMLGTNTSGQRTIIQKFNAFDDESSETETSAAPDPRRAGESHPVNTDDVTTEVTLTEATGSEPPSPIPQEHSRRTKRRPSKKKRSTVKMSTPWDHVTSSDGSEKQSPSPPPADVMESGEEEEEVQEDVVEEIEEEQEDGEEEEEEEEEHDTAADEEEDADEECAVQTDKEEERDVNEVSHQTAERPSPGMLSPSGFSDTLPTAPRPTRPQWMEQGVESDEDAVVPLDLGVRDTLVASSPTPSRPSALSPTPRKAFVDEEDPLREESVPHHGSRTTTSSSSGSRQSQSVAPAAPSKKSKRYTDFDDSDEDD